MGCAFDRARLLAQDRSHASLTANGPVQGHHSREPSSRLSSTGPVSTFFEVAFEIQDGLAERRKGEPRQSSLSRL